MNDISPLIDKYYAWLKNETTFKDVEDWVEITTPYLDRNNDYIQIYLKREDGQYLLTDGGATIDSLEQEGCSIKGKSREDLLKLILGGYGVKKENGRLEIKTKEDNFALRKHSLLQAILSVNDMFYLAKPYVKNLFLDDVRNWLDILEVRYSENICLPGISGYTRIFDFVIPKSVQEPERIIQLINNPVKNNVDVAIMNWLDTKDMRSPESKAYALINDRKKKIPPTIEAACATYEITPLEWSKREEYGGKLAA